MFWNKKEDKNSLPELPPLKPIFPSKFEKEVMQESHPLPAFPDSPIKKDFSQSVIKESIETEDLPELPQKFKSSFEKDFKEMPTPLRKIMPEETAKAKTEDIYVKIERFHSARKALNNAREKLKEIDELMKKIRETKMREEHELSAWELQIESVKSKVEDVTKNIFEKIE